MKILILCTGNSCRSQMAHGFLQSYDKDLEVYSAGTAPATRVHPMAIKVMKEVGVDLTPHTPKSVELFLNQTWDFVITVCGGANENCPTFIGQVKKRLHIGFDDPAEAIGTEEEVIQEFRRIREEILSSFRTFYNEYIKCN